MPLDSEQAALLKRLGETIRQRRIQAKLTQERVAELVGVNSRTFQKIEAGRLNILVTTLARLQKALNCSWDELMR